MTYAIGQSEPVSQRLRQGSGRGAQVSSDGVQSSQPHFFSECFLIWHDPQIKETVVFTS